MRQHKLKWTVIGKHGEVVHFADREDAKAYAYECGARAIYPPIYADE